LFRFDQAELKHDPTAVFALRAHSFWNGLAPPLRTTKPVKKNIKTPVLAASLWFYRSG
jgi:hypothetical protein